MVSNVSTRAGAGVFVVYRYTGIDLPLNLISFNAKAAENNTALISWKAVSDGTPNEYFAVEHSTDGKNFTEIGKVEANIESKNAMDYSFRHLTPANGKNFYRLRMHEASGKKDYSQVATVVIGKSAQAVNVFPNPAGGSLNIDGASQLSSIKMYDMTGRQMNVPVSANGDRTTLQTSQLQNGTYFLQLTGKDGASHNQRVLIQNR